MARHEVKIGDELIVCGSVFIVTHFKLELDQPPTLIVEPPINLLEN